MSDSIIPARVRNYAYPIVTAIAVLLGAYGVIADEHVAVWVALGGAILGNATATAYRPSRTIPDGTGAHRRE